MKQSGLNSFVPPGIVPLHRSREPLRAGATEMQNCRASQYSQ